MLPPPPETTDRTARPPDDFVRLLAAHHGRLFAYVYSLLPNRPDAEDVFQRTSVTLWKKFDHWDPGVAFLSWACGVAFNEVRNFVRVAGRDRLRFGEELLARLAEERPATLESRDERLQALQACLEKLPQRDRDLVNRAYQGEGSVKDLARETGRAVQTLYNHLNLIRRRLFQCIDARIAGEAGPRG